MCRIHTTSISDSISCSPTVAILLGRIIEVILDKDRSSGRTHHHAVAIEIYTDRSILAAFLDREMPPATTKSNRSNCSSSSMSVILIARRATTNNN